jgi:hypothetical protein
MHGRRNSKGNAPRIRIYLQTGLGAGITELNTPLLATNLPPDRSRARHKGPGFLQSMVCYPKGRWPRLFEHCNLRRSWGKHTPPRCSPALWSSRLTRNVSGILQQALVGIRCEVRRCTEICCCRAGTRHFGKRADSILVKPYTALEAEEVLSSRMGEGPEPRDSANT